MFRKLFGRGDDKQPDMIQESSHASGSEERVAFSQGRIGREDVFMALREIDIRQALDLAAKMRISNAVDPPPTFLEGAFAYAMRNDAAALNLFSKSMVLEPLFAEVPYYLGQLLVETAITDYD